MESKCKLVFPAQHVQQDGRQQNVVGKAFPDVANFISKLANQDGVDRVFLVIEYDFKFYVVSCL